MHAWGHVVASWGVHRLDQGRRASTAGVGHRKPGQRAGGRGARTTKARGGRHGYRPSAAPPAAAFTIATMPCRRASGSRGHARITACKAGSIAAVSAFAAAPTAAPN